MENGLISPRITPIPCYSLLFMVSNRDRIAPNCPIRHPVSQIVALQRRVRFSARLAGFGRVGVTRDALEGLKRPHFRFWSLISIFECHVCAKGGERVADRAVQRRKRGRPRGPESRPGLPRRSRLARSGPGLRPGAWHPVAGRCFRCAYGDPESPTSPPTRPRSGARHGSMTIETARRASLEFVCVFGQDGHSQRKRGETDRPRLRAPRQPSTLPGSLAISQSPSSALMTPLDGLDDVHARCDPIGHELLFGETVLHLDPPTGASVYATFLQLCLGQFLAGTPRASPR